MAGWVRGVLPVVVSLALGACATTPAGPGAPQPLKPIAAGQFFNGRWYEIARTPMMFTNGCVAGTTDFFNKPDGTLVERDECRKGTPAGPVKKFQGDVVMLNPGENTKFTVHYVLFYVLPLSQTYWVLDHAPDYDWFIVSNPSFQNVAMLSREPESSPKLVAALTDELRGMGYDVSKLEYPEPFPPGGH
jgi:apolipoprotein D and lipocalin family protein